MRVGVLCEGGGAVCGWRCCVRAAVICEGVHICGLRICEPQNHG